jgi:hypothetical protein
VAAPGYSGLVADKPRNIFCLVLPHPFPSGFNKATFRRGITIRVAANTGDLSAVTTGFVRLARALEHAARRGWVINLLPTLC